MRRFAVGAALADASALEKFPGAKDAIMSYYAANAREGAGNCGAGHMRDIATPVWSARAATRPWSRSTTPSAPRATGGTAACSGPGMREFTLAKGASGWGVSGMTGQAP